MRSIRARRADMRVGLLVVVAIGAWFAIGAVSGFAVSPGALDPAFASDGIYVAGPVFPGDPSVQLRGGAVARTSGGFILGGMQGDGASEATAYIERHLPDGALDASLAGSSRLRLTGFQSVNALGVDMSGRYLAAVSAPSVPSGAAVLRILPTGEYDTSFGTGGVVTIPTLGPADTVTLSSLVVAADGSVTVGGVVQTFLSGASSNVDFVVFRLTPAGALDPGFGSSGAARIDFGGGVDTGRAIAIDSQRRTVVVGTARDISTGRNRVGVARLTPAGGLDATFASGGKLTGVLGTSLTALEGMAVAIDSQQRILVEGFAAFSSPLTVVARLDSSGQLDPAFGTGGSTTLGGYAYGALAVDAADQVVVVMENGSAAPQSGTNVTRLLVDGARDTSIGLGGANIDIVPAGNSMIAGKEAFASVFLTPGRATIVGATTLPGAPYFTVVAARIVLDGAPVPVSTAPPVITGTPKSGLPLQTTRGTWDIPASIRAYAIRWQRCSDESHCTDIQMGQFSSTVYYPGGWDVGLRIRAKVIATGPNGDGVAVSALTPVIQGEAPGPSRLPAIHALTEGAQNRLAVTSPLWFGTPPFTETYAWYRCDAAGDNCTVVPGATERIYVPGDRNGTFRAQVTATNAWGTASSARSTAARLITMPDITMVATSPAGAVFQPVIPSPFSLVLDPAPPVICDPAVGTVLPVGDTLVGCYQSDATASGGGANFHVIVTAAPGGGSTGGGSAGGSGGGGGGSNLPDLEVSQVVSRGQAVVGDLVTFTSSVVLKNFAVSSGASNLVLTDVLPAGLEPVSVSTNRGSCVSGQTVVCNLSFIASGVTAQVVVTAKVVGSGEIVNAVVVRADESDLDPSNNVATVRLNSPLPVAPLTPPTPKPVVKKPVVAKGITRTGTARQETLRGTERADTLDGRGGNDKILGLAGDDLLLGGTGKDTIDAGSGNDTVRVRDGARDTVRCGPGTDTVIADTLDILTSCEKTTRR